MPPQQIRLVGYSRVSKVGDRDVDSESFQTVDEQRRLIGHAAALRPGAEVVEWIDDLDQSGGTMDRPGLNRALQMIRSGRADGIAVARLDRWARTGKGIEMIEDLEATGKTFISATDAFDTSTSHGRFALGMMVLVARLQRDQHIESWDRSTRNAVERGVPMQIPYGYTRSNGRGSALVPHPSESKVVARIYAERMQGTGINMIAAGLTSDDIPAPRSAAWTPATVRRIVRNRAYRGEARYGKHVRRDAHEPLVSDDVWYAAQPGRATVRSERAPTLLGGLVRCDGCGYVMGGSVTKTGRRFGCGRIHATGACPAPTTAPADRLEQIVADAFLERYGTEVLVAGAQTSDPEVAETAAERARAQREFVTWRDDTRMRELLGEDDYLAGLDVRRRERDAADAAHDRAVLDARHEQLAVNDAVWAGASVPERRELLRAGIDAVLVSRAASTHTPLSDRVEILWSGQAPDDLVAERRGTVRPDHHP